MHTPACKSGGLHVRRKREGKSYNVDMPRLPMRQRRVWMLLVPTILAFGCSEQTASVRAVSGLEVIEADATGDVANLVQITLDETRKQNRNLLVYVSASWCEPCRYFEQAVDAGELVDTFPRLTLMKFDYDRDEDRLAHADYQTDMIPMFAVPAADGTGTSQRVVGSIKGPHAVEKNLVPRLKKLLAR